MKRYKIEYCRTFQKVMKAGNYVLGYRTPEVIKGPGSVLLLPEEIKKKGLHHILFVTDEKLIELNLPTPLLQALSEAGIEYTIFSNIKPNPTDKNVEEGYQMFHENGCEGIVAFGGGSPIDCAKAIGAKNAHPNKSIRDLQGILKVHKRIVPFWAIPTTAGTGSETTLAAVITEEETHHKASINDPALFPICAILDPELTVGLPPFITATTGMDALCHAVESYTNWTYCTKLEKEYSKKAVKLIHDYLYTAYEDGTNMDARLKMQEAAFYAGRSFTRGCVGYVHAIGHTLGGLYNIPHGLAMSVILPHVLRKFGPAVYKRLEELADACGIEGKSRADKALNFIQWIEDLNEKMGIPKGFKEIKEEDIPQMIKWADAEANPLYPVPVIWFEEDFRDVIEELREDA